jgi:uncharacterized ubiquitin-like protein YukD
MVFKAFAIILIFVFSIPACIAQVSKTIHQTFTLDNAEKITLDLDSKDINYKETKGTRILVETKITLSLPNQSLLDFVVNNGRYNLIKSVDATSREISLSSQKNKNVIVVRGKECVEDVVHTIYVPSSIKRF